MARRVIYDPQVLSVRLRIGWRARIERLCDEQVTTPSMWARAAIERAVKTDERRARAAAQREREAAE